MSIGHHAGNLSAPTIVSAETMQRAILECGLVPFFENPIAGYSVEEMTHPSYWFDGDAGVLGPWDWKIDCVQSGDILYGKYLCGGKAAFATFEWYRELRNYRQSLSKYALLPGPQSEVMDYVNEHGSISVKEVRALLGVKKSAADALLTRLQMQCRLLCYINLPQGHSEGFSKTVGIVLRDTPRTKTGHCYTDDPFPVKPRPVKGIYRSHQGKGGIKTAGKTYYAFFHI